MSSVTVVIPTILNHPYRLKLLHQIVPMAFVKQVILVDNGNNFKQPTYEDEVWNKIEVIRPGCNLNWLHSNNLGATLAIERKSPYVCFLNDDVAVSPGIFPELVKTFENHKDAGLVVPQYNGVFGHKATSQQTWETWKSRDRDERVRWVDGTCMLIPARTIKQVGLLDPCFRAPNWGADVDYGHRVKAAGMRLYVSHRAMVWHHTDLGGLSARKIHGDAKKWLQMGCKQAPADLKAKYGPNWCKLLSLPAGSYGKRSKVKATKRKRVRRKRA